MEVFLATVNEICSFWLLFALPFTADYLAESNWQQATVGYVLSRLNTVLTSQITFSTETAEISFQFTREIHTCNKI